MRPCVPQVTALAVSATGMAAVTSFPTTGNKRHSGRQNPANFEEVSLSMGGRH